MWIAIGLIVKYNIKNTEYVGNRWNKKDLLIPHTQTIFK